MARVLQMAWGPLTILCVSPCLNRYRRQQEYGAEGKEEAKVRMRTMLWKPSGEFAVSRNSVLDLPA